MKHLLPKLKHLGALPALITLLLLPGLGWGQYNVNFDGTSDGTSASAYGFTNHNLNGITWTGVQVIIPTTPLAADWYNGVRSLRLRGYSTSDMTMTSNKANGIGTISFNYRRYGTDSQVAWKVEYSTNDGGSWTQVGSDFTAPSDDNIQVFSQTVNVSGNARIRIIHASGGASSNRRLNIDDLLITDYSGSVTAPTTQASNITFGSIGQDGMTTSWTNGDGAKRVVIMNTSNSFTNPTDGSDPTANPAYGGSGEQVVYNGSGSSVAVTGLSASTTYWFRVYEYNGSGTGTLYLTSTATNNPNSQVTSNLTVATPTFDPAEGTYITAQNVTISSATSGATIYYTTDGTDPNNSGNGTLYSSPVSVSETTTLKARAYASGYDPSTIAIATYTILVAQTTTIPYAEDFTAGIGQTYSYSVSGDSKVWLYNAGGFMNMNGFGGAAVEEDWLVLPGLNLDNYTGSKILTFDTWYNFGTINADNYLKLYYSTDYAGVGDPTSSTWTELSYTQPASTSTWTSSGDVDLSAISGTSVYIAFKYRGITSGYNSWSVDNISIQNPKYAVTFNVDMNGTSGYTNVYVAGTFNGWNTTASQMTTSGGNIFTFSTDAIFDSSDEIEFKFVKDGTTYESISNRTYTVVSGTNIYNGYWNSATLPQLDFVNLQYPASGTISAGDAYDVYAQVYEAGLTEAAGQGSNVSCWIGYSTENTNPNTWTEWVPATFNVQSGNNDEYTANIGTGLTGGTYYYASRFKYGLADYVYGGFSGGFWDGSNNISGVLTVNAAEPSAHVSDFAATGDNASSITVTWTDANPSAENYLIKGSNVSYDAITAPIDGTPETDGGLVKNIAAGVQTYQFTGLSENTPYYFKIFPYNGAGSQINYRTAETVPQATATTTAAPTILQSGDIAILQLNSTNPDRIAFVTFVDLNPGTVINFTDNGFTSPTSVRTGEGFLTYTAPTTILAGTVISWYNGMTVIGTGWSSGSPTNFALANPDQLFAYQGEWSSPSLIYGVSTSPWLTEGSATSNTSYLPSDLVDGVSAFCFPSNVANAYYSNLANGTPSALKSLITFSTNWATSSSDQGAQSWTFTLGNSTTLTQNASCFNLHIASGESFTINQNVNLTVNGSFTNEAGTSAFLVKSDATGTGSLIHSTAGVPATVERYITAATWETAGSGWHLLSSPVAAQSISGNWTPTGTGNDYDFYAFDETATTEYWLNQKVGANNITAFIPGKGYLVAYQQTDTKTFSGNLNVADVTLSGLTNTGTSAYPGWHLAGNPFASAINWGSGTWTKTNINAVAQVWSSADGSYKTTTEQSDIIPAMNGFMVYTAGSGELTIPAGAREHNAANWYKSDEEFILLKSNDLEGLTSQSSIVRFNPSATEAYDADFDAYFLAGFAPMFYSVSGSSLYALNTLPAISNELAIPFGFMKNSATNYSIELAKNIPATIVYLTDIKTGTVTNLTDEGAYHFTAAEGDDANRFTLHFGTLGMDDPSTAAPVNIYAYGGVVYLNGLDAKASVTITDLTGRVVLAERVNGNGLAMLNAAKLPKGVYVVTAVAGSRVVSAKVIL